MPESFPKVAQLVPNGNPADPITRLAAGVDRGFELVNGSLNIAILQGQSNGTAIEKLEKKFEQHKEALHTELDTLKADLLLAIAGTASTVERISSSDLSQHVQLAELNKEVDTVKEQVKGVDKKVDTVYSVLVGVVKNPKVRVIFHALWMLAVSYLALSHPSAPALLNHVVHPPNVDAPAP